MQKGLEIIKTNSKVCSTTKLCKYHIHLAQQRDDHLAINSKSEQRMKNR